MIELIIEHNGSIYQPVLKDNIQLKSVRKGEPSTLTFTLLRDDVIEYEEGDPVRVKIDGQNAFYGFIFKITGNKTAERQITAYDQLRYLKNKYTYVLEKKRADEIVKMICEDYGLQVGTLDNTEYLYSNIEDNVALFDIILNALDETTRNTNPNKMYVLYDDMGKLCLKDIESRKLDILLDEETGENFSYSSSIDGETYNSIVLYRESKSGSNSTSNRSYAYVSDPNNIEKWGVLQYFGTFSEDEDGKTKAAALLELYNQKSKSLTLENQLGDIRVMGGTLVPVRLDLGDAKLSNYMMVEEVTHTISENHHTMNLKLKGGEFNE